MKTNPTILALAALAGLANPVLAKGNPDPKVPRELQPVHRLVGEWTAKNGSMTLEGKKHRVDMTISCTPTAGGVGVACRTSFNIEGLGNGLEETDLFGYDEGANRYHWFSVTQMGETHDHVAVPPGDKDPSLTFAYSGLQAGKPVQEVIRMTFNDDGSKIDFRNDGILAGQPAWLLTATIVKK